MYTFVNKREVVQRVKAENLTDALGCLAGEFEVVYEFRCMAVLKCKNSSYHMGVTWEAI